MYQNTLYYIIAFLLGYIVSNHMNQRLIEGDHCGTHKKKDSKK